MLSKAITISIALALSLQAQATTEAENLKWCLVRVADAERVIDACGKALSDERDYATASARQNARLQEQLAASQAYLERQDAWYRDPLFIGVIGLVAGSLATTAIVNGTR